MKGDNKMDRKAAIEFLTPYATMKIAKVISNPSVSDALHSLLPNEIKHGEWMRRTVRQAIKRHLRRYPFV